MSTPLTDRELHEMYDAMIDEFQPSIAIMGLNYTTSDTWKEIDPIAYNCGFVDWLDSECDEGNLFDHDDEYYLTASII